MHRKRLWFAGIVMPGEIATAIASAVQWFAIGYFAAIGFLSDSKDAEND